MAASDITICGINKEINKPMWNFDSIWPIVVKHDTHLTDGGEFGEEHLEDWGRQSLLQYLQKLLWLPTDCNGIGQVVHTFLIISC